jgi:hypothetical protein
MAPETAVQPTTGITWTGFLETTDPLQHHAQGRIIQCHD